MAIHYTYTFAGSSTTQADDAQSSSIIELSKAQTTYDWTTRVKTLVSFLQSSFTLAQTHQMSFWADGYKVSANIYGVQINPANFQGGNVQNLGIQFNSKARIQFLGSQQSEAATAAAESFNVGAHFLESIPQLKRLNA